MAGDKGLHMACGGFEALSCPPKTKPHKALLKPTPSRTEKGHHCWRFKEILRLTIASEEVRKIL